MSEEETTKKAKGIIEEFHSLYDYKEVAECIKELKEKNAKLGIVLKYWLTDLLEGKKRSVDNFRKLIKELGSAGLFTKDDFNSGLVQIICTLEDLEIDVPKAPSIVAQIMADLVAAKRASIDALGKPLSKAFEDFTGDKVENLFDDTEVYQDFALHLHKSLVLQDAAPWQLKDVQAEFAKAGIKLKPFEEKKIERHGCKAIFAGPAFVSEATQALQGGADLSEWYDRNLAGVAGANPKLACSTLAEVLRRAIADPKDASTSKINPEVDLEKELDVIVNPKNGLFKLFQKALGKGGLAVEFDCLLALQLVHHNLGAPKGLMTRLLTDFYDSDVLSEESFTKWRDDNKDETPGKLKAISDCTSYLNWLAEQSSEDESDEKE